MMTELHFLEQAADRLRDALCGVHPAVQPARNLGTGMGAGSMELGPDPGELAADLGGGPRGAASLGAARAVRAVA